MSKRIYLTALEIDALLAAAGNVDPCMFEEGAASDKEAEIAIAAWHSGQDKLRRMRARSKTK